MEQINLSEDKRNSITLKKGAKGYLWDIKVYFKDEDKNKALDMVDEINMNLKLKYEV